MLTQITTILVFFIFLNLLIIVILFAKSKLTKSGPVKILINNEKEITVNAGSNLLSTLSENKIFLPSACGGGGTCAMCKCQIESGGGDMLPTEKPYFTRKEQQQNYRLGCQVKVKEDMNVQIPDEIFGIKKWECEVVSNYNVATYIKEFIVEIPEDMDYKAGGYIQIEIPNCTVPFKEMDITAHPEDHPGEPSKFESDW